MPNPSQDFIGVITAIQTKLMDELPVLTTKLTQLTDSELTIIARELDFFSELNRHGYSKAVSDLMKEYDDVVVETFRTAKAKGIEPSVTSFLSLELAKELDAETLLGKANEFSSKLKSELLKGIISGENGASIVSRLRQFEGFEQLSSANLNMIVNDSFARFSNSATFKAFEENDQQRYIYTGVLDGVTRQACEEVLTNPQNEKGFTVDEIGGLKGGLSARVGFNCRHDWAAV